MPDGNRFAGLGDAVDEEDEPESPTEEASSESTESEQASTDSQPGESELEETEPEEQADPAAFPFDETTKKTVYVREDAIERLEDAQALVDAQLRTEHDVRNLTGREFYDAVFQVAAGDTDALIDQIIDERDE
ncbi:hypothetical protein [Haloarchaeobius sp. DFWS5]|uniref:hypothetical protein n=1 Tax=Haloarchaeobius sp. DFWS5 TaxID=3446114 RepID=UPI003EB8B19B